MRILNADTLASHSNIAGRKAVLDILEAGLQAADPYTNTRRLMHLEGNRLILDHPDYAPQGAPWAGPQVIDLSAVGNIYVFGAGKGIQYAAQAIEDVLRDRLTGGHVIAKHGDPLVLQRIGVTYGAHPVPDEGCAAGCRRILEMAQGLKENDLVFTLVANGISSLLTLPMPGISLAEVRQLTYVMQIERGVPTRDLNAVRNHVDVMKGGKISRFLRPAQLVHILVYDPQSYHDLMYENRFLHTLAESTTFQEAIDMLHKWDAWEAVAPSIREHLLRADPAQETVKPDEFAATGARIWGVLPRRLGMVPAAVTQAAALGFTPHVLTANLRDVEAAPTGYTLAAIARSIEDAGVPFEPPCALFTAGELVVTVGAETGIGGRNQEYTLAAALRIAGSANIVIGAVDSDGTDGPGGQFAGGGVDVPCLAGGLVDGQTVAAARAAGVNIRESIRKHDTSPALWAIDSGIWATQNVSMGDLNVILVMGRK